MFGTDGAFSGFSVDDVSAAREFYGTTLGLDVTDDPMGFLNITLRSGGIILVYGKDNHEPASYTILNFPVADVAAAVKDLRARGVEMIHYDGLHQDDDGIARGGGGPDIAWFADPAGNVLSVLSEGP